MFCEKTHGPLLVGVVPGGACTGGEETRSSLLETRPGMLHCASIYEHGCSNWQGTLGSVVLFTGQKMDTDPREEAKAMLALQHPPRGWAGRWRLSVQRRSCVSGVGELPERSRPSEPPSRVVVPSSLPAGQLLSFTAFPIPAALCVIVHTGLS